MAVRRRGRWGSYLLGTGAATITAVAGAAAVDPDSQWYRDLDKPDWQPPPQAFGLVWTPLYGTVAWSAGRTLQRCDGAQRRRYLSALTSDLALNAGWNWLFFGAQNPAAGLVGIAALNLANLRLIKQTAKIDKVAAAVLVPYALWCGFATALNASIWRRNRPS